MLKTGQLWCGTFVTRDSTGALSAATTGPVGTLYVDGVANGASVTITGTNPYKFSVTLPTLTAGQNCGLYITATIATIATAGFVAQDQADTVLVSDIATTLGVAGAGLTAIGDTRLANLDVPISSRMPTGSLGNLDVPVSSRLASGTLGNLDVPISSRQPTGTNFSNLSNLDVPVSSRLPTGSLAYLDVPVSSRMATGTIAPTTDPWTTNLPSSYTTGSAGYIVGNIATVNDIWAVPTGTINTPGSVGVLLQSRVDVPVSSRMPTGTSFAYLDVPVSSRMASGTVIAAGGYVGMVTGSAMSLISGSGGGTVINNNTYNNTNSNYVQPVSTVSPNVGQVGNDVNVLTGDSWRIQFNNLGSLAGLGKIYLTVKGSKLDTDSASLVQIEKTAGLIFLNGASATPALGSVTVQDANLGNILVFLDASQSRLLAPTLGLYYDVQYINTSGSVTTLQYGNFNIMDDITKAVT